MTTGVAPTSAECCCTAPGRKPSPELRRSPGFEAKRARIVHPGSRTSCTKGPLTDPARRLRAPHRRPRLDGDLTDSFVRSDGSAVLYGAPGRRAASPTPPPATRTLSGGTGCRPCHTSSPTDASARRCMRTAPDASVRGRPAWSPRLRRPRVVAGRDVARRGSERGEHPSYIPRPRHSKSPSRVLAAGLDLGWQAADEHP